MHCSMAVLGLSPPLHSWSCLAVSRNCPTNSRQLRSWDGFLGSTVPFLGLERFGASCNREGRKMQQILNTTTKDSTDKTSALPAPLSDQLSSSHLSQESDFQVVTIAKDTLGLRGQTSDRLKFEVEYGLKRGTTDNSYVIKGTSDIALIDVPDQVFQNKFEDSLERTVDLTAVTHIVIGHISPMRVQTLIAICKKLGRRSSPLQVHCSNPAAQLLLASLPESLKDDLIVKAVRTGDYLDIGGGHKLEFILTPTPRWPDGMCTYDRATQLLFTQKLFSAHVYTPNYFDMGGWDAYGEDWKFFYDCMLSPVPRQAQTALQRLPIVAQFSKPNYTGKTGIELVKADLRYIASTVASALRLPNNMTTGFENGFNSEGLLVTASLCPIHGPVVRYTVTELVREYQSWTKERLKQIQEVTIAVIYASAYGNTTALAQAISRGISKAGVGVQNLNMEQSTSEDVDLLLQQSSGFAIGSPTLGGHIPTPVQDALGAILKCSNARAKPCGVFGSFGWSGEAIDEIEKRLKDGGFYLAFPSIRCKFKPTESMLQVCEESGTDLAQAVRRMLVKQSKPFAQFTVASNVEQAVGRVIGSLCVLSAKDGDAESAMLASWVSQASFVPPGLTVAVAKERAVESLVLPGGRFVLNVLGKGKSAAICKQLLKQFKPGEFRFEGLQTKEAKDGGQILLDAISWMECTVKSRMETGDHWIVYATVDDGNVLDDKILTAIHYRKTGARY
eukprot:c19779_g1_i1 orf=449-2638(-)